MSYILDALKKSEREKTLGQVPTLESVVTDGAKKQRSGTPWWLNLIVFFVAMLAVVGILKMAGLISFSSSENGNSQQTLQSEASLSGSRNSEPAAEGAVADPASGSLTQPSVPTDQNTLTVVEAEGSADTAGQDQGTPPPAPERADEAEALQIAEISSQALTEVPADLPPQNDGQQTGADENSVQLLEDKFTEQEAEELAALAQQAEAQMLAAQKQLDEAGSNDPNAGQDSARQSTQPQYEAVIHDSLRDIAVNVVSYSSDARQRFVMLDLTIFKEGDQFANNAQVIEIIRTGAIVEYQNKRYLLKP